MSAILAPIIASVLIARGGTDLLWLTGAAAGIAVDLACSALRHRLTLVRGDSRSGAGAG